MTRSWSRLPAAGHVRAYGHALVPALVPALVLALVLAGGPAIAAAQPSATTPVAAPPTAADLLIEAGAAADQGDWPRVVARATPVAGDLRQRAADRAEAHRLLGLAALDGDQSERAEAHFFAYLKLDLDGRLDPNLYPPETVAFFEGVRGKHAAALRALRPKPRRAMLLNLIPPAGQFQNRERTKAWVLAGVGGTLLISNLGSYVLLRSWCDGDDGTCEGHTRSARFLRDLNLGTGIALVGLYAYGVYDGLRHYESTPSFTVAPVAFSDGGGLGVAGVF